MAGYIKMAAPGDTRHVGKLVLQVHELHLCLREKGIRPLLSRGFSLELRELQKERHQIMVQVAERTTSGLVQPNWPAGSCELCCSSRQPSSVINLISLQQFI